MTSITICFYCQETVKLRESIMVKKAIQSHEVLHRYHPECYAKLIRAVTQALFHYDETLEEMRNAIQAAPHSGPQIPEQAT